MTTRFCLPCAAMLALAACSSVDDEIFEPAPDSGTPQPASSLAFAGVYEAAQHWNMSEIFYDDEGIGGLVADLIVSSVVELAGVPGSLKDEARTLVADSVRAPIRDFVNAKVPADLVPDSTLLTQLGEIFGDIQVDSSIGFAGTDDPNAFTGSEKIDAIRITYEDTTYDIPLATLLEGTGASRIQGDFTGTVTGQTSLSVGKHTLVIRAGTIVSIAGFELLDRDDLDTLTQQALDAIVCTDLIDLLVDGGASYGIEIGGESFSVDATDLASGCAAIKLQLADYVLGYVDRDAPVTVGGPVTMTDDDDDDLAEALIGTASYEGEAELVTGYLIRDFAITLAAARQ